MKITTVLGLLIGAHFIQGLLGLPVDRELFRVKRKGEGEIHDDVVLVRKVRRLQDDKETERRHKRRFFATENEEPKPQGYKTKMEARSSRSAREDNDVTAGRPERFRVMIQKRSTEEGESSSITGEHSGSGEQPRKSSTSGAELWSSKSSIAELQAKRDEKRSTSTNSLNSLISALRAISSLTPDEQDTSGEEIEFSGSGLWLRPEKEVKDDKLPKFFQEEGNSGSGENPEDALSRINEAAQRELNEKVEDESSGERKYAKEESQHGTGEKLFKRELKSDSLADDLMAAVEDYKESPDSEPEDNLSSLSGSAMQQKEDELEGSTPGPPEPEEGQFNKEPEVMKSTNVESIRSLTDFLLPESFYRARRSSQENLFLRSDNNLGENDALDSSSLVSRFYRDQDALSDAPEISEVPLASLPSDSHNALNAGKHPNPEKRETHYEHSGDLSEPRVVYTREIRNDPEPIIERPAVYSHSVDENEMDSSFGGEDDDEATLAIHEREIREDGYVGCFEDQSPYRDLPTVLSVPDLTPDSCRSACQGAGHAYAGVQYGYLCRCGDSYGKYNKVPDEECNALCTGDKAQKCGGFWRSAIFTTAGAMQPSKRGNFFHIDSVQPMTEDIFDMPRSEIPSGEEESHEASTLTESSKVTESTAQTPKEPPPIPAAKTPESSEAYIKETYRETSLQESPVSSTPGITVQESTLPSNPSENNSKDDSVAHAQPAEPTQVNEDASLWHALAEGSLHESEDTSSLHHFDSASGDTSSPSHDIVPPPVPSVSQKAASHESQSSEIVATPQQVTIPLDSPANQARSFAHPQNDQPPQGTHVSQLVYLHHQHDILSKLTPKSIVTVPPGKVEEGTVAYTGTVKLKQSWLDQFQDGESAASKILTGNIEQAFKRVFKNEPKFVNAEVVGFREGLVKHNPNTIRKVIAPFIITFKNGVKGVEEKLKDMVKKTGRLDDMPVYKNSLQIAEYGHSPAAVEKANKVNDTVKKKHERGGNKRSAVNIPNGGVDAFLKGIFSQISTEKKDISFQRH